jgi:hypothetical protein
VAMLVSIAFLAKEARGARERDHIRQVTARRLQWVDGLFESAAHNLPGKSRLIPLQAQA